MAKLVALGTVLLAGLLGLTLPAYAEPELLEWSKVSLPAPGEPGGWQLALGTDIGQLSQTADGRLYTAKLSGDCQLLVSEDGGLSWAETDYEGAAITAIVGSRLDAETLYLADSSHVYKSDDGGESFARLGEGTLPVLDANEAICCLDIGYDGNNSIVFIGTADGDGGNYGGIYYFNEGEFGAGWAEMGAGGYDIYSIAASPGFDGDSHLIALASDEVHSYIINNYGARGDWSRRTELLKDNSSLAVSAASRFVFPADFESFNEFYIGVSAGGQGGVYRVEEESAYDLGLDADIASLDFAEDGTTLLAGGDGVWLSPDGGESWETNLKAPTGDWVTGVALAPDFADSGTAYAATSGTESAFSVSRDGGSSWNQTSLIDTKISTIVDLAPSPGYGQDKTLFMLTHHTDGKHSLWRSIDGGESWERVFGSALPGVTSLRWLELSPDYGDDHQIVLLAGESDGNPSIWKSTDNGQNFARRNAPISVDVWAVADENSWFIGGYDGSHGLVCHTTNSGLSYSEGVTIGGQPLKSIALSPDYNEDGTILAGNQNGWVYWSEDNGQSFEPLPSDAVSSPLSGAVTVAFDPAYGSNGTVYAASDSAGEGIYRFTVGDSDWENIDSPDDSLIGPIVVGAEGTLYAANYAADGGMERCLDPTFPLTPTFESVTRGLDDGAKLVGLWLVEHQLWSIDSSNNQLVSYIDSLTPPVSLISPADAGPGVGMLIDNTVRNVSLDWETLPGATDYQWQLNYEEDFSSLPEDFEGTTQASSARLPILEPITTYYWKVRAIEPVLSPWSEKWSFTTALGTASSVPILESPAAGAEGVPVEPTFQWSAIAGADSYELMVSTFAAFDNPTILKTGDYALAATAWQCNVILDYDTTYYWKVRAVGADSYSAWSAVSAFTTESPIDPTGTVAEVSQPENSEGEQAWPEWLLPAGGIIMLVLLVTMVAMVIVMVVLVIKLSKL